MKQLKAIAIIVLVFIYSCNPRISTKLNISYPAIDYRDEVAVIGLNEEAPDNAELIGKVNVGDTGFTTNCEYDFVLDQAKLEARRVGGNAIKIIKHNRPNPMGSSCHRIKAIILKIDSNDSNISEQNELESLETKNK
ncbi:hypothetical protein OAA06_01465 [bacterium]|nr:hypothetical protein [bacterium]